MILRNDSLRDALMGWLAEQPGQTVRREAFFEQAGDAKIAQALLARRDGFVPQVQA